VNSTLSSSSENRHWRIYLGLTLASLFLLGWIYRATAQSLVAIWQSSETYAHGYIIFPISLFLIWRERAYLSTITPRPSALGLLALVLLALGWLVAESVSVQVLTQYLFVAMISALITALLGWRVVRAIAFPLTFTLLAVPFGDIFLRPMMDFTADFTVYALQLTGIPVFHEGNHLSLPTGEWSVVEACSGLRYLIASFTLGCLYAHLNYRSRLRKLAFIAASLIVPIIANGIRAYLIVLLGHFSNMQLATGVDHLIYGWLFFGLVVFLLFWAGSFWREDTEISSQKNLTSNDVAAGAPTLKVIGFAVAALSIAGAAPLYLHHLEQQSYNPAPVTLTLPPTLNHWTATPPASGLQPSFPGANATLLQEYRNGDQIIGIYLAFFRDQRPGAETISSQNIIARLHSPEWNIVAESVHDLHGEPGRVVQNRLLWGNSKMLAWRWYWIGGTHTANDFVAKALQAKQRLTGKGDEGADIVIFAPHNMQSEEIAVIMENFLAQANPAIQQSLLAASKK